MTKKREGAKMGRPPMDPEDVRSINLGIRITRRERALIQAEAKRAGITLGEVVMRAWRARGRKQ